MMGFAVAVMHVSPKEFWKLTPMEYFKAARGYKRVNDPSLKSDLSAEEKAHLRDIMEDPDFGRRTD